MVDFVFGQLFAVKVFFHQVFTGLGNGFHDHFTERFQLFLHIFRYFHVKAAVVLSFASGHINNVDDAAHVLAFAHG